MNSLLGSPHACPLCAQPNRCAVAAAGRFDVVCWCSSVEIAPATIDRVRKASVSAACLCMRCATTAAVEARA